MHLLVAGLVFGVAAARVHDNRTAGFAAGLIKMNLSAFQLKCSVDVVQRGIERECNLGLRGIEVDDVRLRASSGSKCPYAATGDEEDRERTHQLHARSTCHPRSNISLARIGAGLG